jgi:hypothetical protein
MFNPGFTSPNLLYASPAMPLQGCHLLWPGFPAGSCHYWLIRFRSPLLTESLLLSFPLGTEMFQFPRFASYAYAFSI